MKKWLKILPHDFTSVLLQAAEISLKYYDRLEECNPTQKSDGTYVTDAEHEINKYLKHSLQKLFKAAWLSEEEKDTTDRLNNEYVWIIDPIDGTKEFLNSNPEFAISIGLAFQGKPILGGVINPVTQQYGVGFLDGYSYFHNLKNSIRTSHVVSVSRTEWNKGKISPFISKFHKIVPLGSVAYKLLRLAAGEEDLYFSTEAKSDWDICGGVALLNSRDMVFKNWNQKEWLFNQNIPRTPSGAIAGNRIYVEDCFKNLAIDLNF